METDKLTDSKTNEEHNEKNMETQIVERKNKSGKNVKVFRPPQKFLRGVPPEILNDPDLLSAIEALPSNYDFEIPKTVWRIRKLNAKCVALQLPEGLQRFAFTISDIIETHTNAEVMVMADVSYGACCVDDISAADMGADLLVHYAHSCLVRVDQTIMPVLYVFVDIKFDSGYFLDSVCHQFSTDTPLALVAIVQFVASLQSLAKALRERGYSVLVPQSSPLSPGEILGCTSPSLPSRHTILQVGDGRFHLESIMISNPELDFYIYSPYNKVLYREYYDQAKMKQLRAGQIARAAKEQVWGIVYSTLGRQGNERVRAQVQAALEAAGKTVVSLDHDYLSPEVLGTCPEVGAWVQLCCPRLSVDWGHTYPKPLLSTYECNVALGSAAWSDTRYPMDYYAEESLGPWTPNHVAPCPCGLRKATGCKGKRCPSRK